jgi:hypothetical protein
MIFTLSGATPGGRQKLEKYCLPGEMIQRACANHVQIDVHQTAMKMAIGL